MADLTPTDVAPPDWLTKHTVVEASGIHVAIASRHFDEACELLGDVFTLQTGRGRTVRAEVVGVSDGPRVFLRELEELAPAPMPRSWLDWERVDPAYHRELLHRLELAAAHLDRVAEVVGHDTGMADELLGMVVELRERMAAAEVGP